MRFPPRCILVNNTVLHRRNSLIAHVFLVGLFLTSAASQRRGVAMGRGLEAGTGTRNAGVMQVLRLVQTTSKTAGWIGKTPRCQ